MIEKGMELLSVEDDVLSMTMDEMLRQEDVIRQEEAIYLPPFYFSESGTAKRMAKLLE